MTISSELKGLESTNQTYTRSPGPIESGSDIRSNVPLKSKQASHDSCSYLIDKGF